MSTLTHPGQDQPDDEQHAPTLGHAPGDEPGERQRQGDAEDRGQQGHPGRAQQRAEIERIRGDAGVVDETWRADELVVVVHRPEAVDDHQGDRQHEQKHQRRQRRQQEHRQLETRTWLNQTNPPRFPMRLWSASPHVLFRRARMTSVGVSPDAFL